VHWWYTGRLTGEEGTDATEDRENKEQEEREGRSTVESDTHPQCPSRQCGVDTFDLATLPYPSSLITPSSPYPSPPSLFPVLPL